MQCTTYITTAWIVFKLKIELLAAHVIVEKGNCNVLCQITMAYERSLKTDCAKYFDSVHHYCYSCQVTKHVIKEKCTQLMNFSIMTKNKNEHMYSRVKSYDIQNKKKTKNRQKLWKSWYSSTGPNATYARTTALKISCMTELNNTNEWNSRPLNNRQTVLNKHFSNNNKYHCK